MTSPLHPDRAEATNNAVVPRLRGGFEAVAATSLASPIRRLLGPELRPEAEAEEEEAGPAADEDPRW